MTNQFTKTFRDYVCEGDIIGADIEGFHITAKIVRDDCGDKPDERDCGFWPSLDHKDAGFIGKNPEISYEKQMARAHKIMNAWANGEWFYCGVVLSVARSVKIKGRVQDEVMISDHAASLWGIECNYPGSKNEYLTDVANELVSEALEHAKECLKQIAA